MASAPSSRPKDRCACGAGLDGELVALGVDGIEVSERDILDGAVLAAPELPEREEGDAPPGADTCC